jgi:hypothetical protein
MIDAFAPLDARLVQRLENSKRLAIGIRPSGQPAILGTVVAQSQLPTSTGRYYSVQPTSVIAHESEGAVASLVVGSLATPILVCVIGTQSVVSSRIAGLLSGSGRRR